MSITLRQGTPADAPVCGRIAYEAFKDIAERHNFPPDFQTPEQAVAVLSMLLGHPGFYVVVAETGGRIVGSNAIDERSEIPGIGPITVDPTLQNHRTGRQLMEHMLERVAARRCPGVRLVQSAYHNRSLALYTKLGFIPREPLSCVQGPRVTTRIPGYAVRPASEADLEACNALCLRIHGHTRSGELLDAIRFNAAMVVESDGRITGYGTGVAFFAHAVGESDNDIKALIAAAPSYDGPGFLVPTLNATLLRWCLEHGLHIVQPMTLMSRGLYNEPQGAFLPSIAY